MLTKHRRQIEPLVRNLENIGLQQIRATTSLGFFLMVQAALLSSVFTNM